jgi:hypothetical protein
MYGPAGWGTDMGSMGVKSGSTQRRRVRVGE